MRRSIAPVASVLLAIVVAVSIASVLSTWAAQDEIVAFNTSSLKYHCLTCQWALKCTKNCVDIPKSEAIKRGGVPCKVCGGSCG